MSEDDSGHRVGTISHAVSCDELKPGDHIYAYGFGFAYSHHGIYLGEDDNEVIHFSQTQVQSRCSITSCTLEEFCKGSQLRLVAYNVSVAEMLVKRRGTCHTEKSDTTEKVLDRARYYLNHPNEWPQYDLISNNCEHFAFYCKTGKRNN